MPQMYWCQEIVTLPSNSNTSICDTARVMRLMMPLGGQIVIFLSICSTGIKNHFVQKSFSYHYFPFQGHENKLKINKFML